ncbi:MAG: hypothetical protein QM754_10730 [Tepidisphaeraceae bacterium]
MRRRRARLYATDQDRPLQGLSPLRTYEEVAEEWNRVSGQKPIGRGTVHAILKSALEKLRLALSREDEPTNPKEPT